MLGRPRPCRLPAASGANSMFETFVITLREGVEAALLLSIALAILRRRGLDALRGPLVAGAALALAASVAVTALAVRITWNEELAEGMAMLVGAVLVGSLVWWMWRAGPHFKEHIESGIGRATAAPRGAALGMFLLAFGTIFRE